MSGTKERIDKMQEAYDQQSPPEDDSMVGAIADEIEADIIRGHFLDTTIVLEILRDFFNRAVRDELPIDVEKYLSDAITDAITLGYSNRNTFSRILRYAIRQEAIKEAKCRI